MQNKDIQVEAERGELLVRNSHGDIAIIPRDKASKVRELLSSGCNDCIDNVVSSLPTLKHYAQDGTVIPNDRKILLYTGKDSRYDVKTMAPRKGVRQNDDGSNSTHLMSYTSAGNKYYAYPTLFQNGDKWVQLDDKNDFAAFKEAQKRKEVFEFNTEKEAADFAKGSWKNQYKEYDINSPEYEELYNSGHLASYDKNTDTYIATPLPEVVITAKKPQLSKDKEALEKEFSRKYNAVAVRDNTRVNSSVILNKLNYTSDSLWESTSDDSVLENIIEFIDPTGLTSWDDVRRSYKENGLFSGTTALEIFGALPLLGKIGKSGKVIAGGFELLQKLIPLTKTKKQQDILYKAYQNYNKIGGKKLDEMFGKTSEILRDNIDL